MLEIKHYYNYNLYCPREFCLISELDFMRSVWSLWNLHVSKVLSHAVLEGETGRRLTHTHPWFRWHSNAGWSSISLAGRTVRLINLTEIKCNSTEIQLKFNSNPIKLLFKMNSKSIQNQFKINSKSIQNQFKINSKSIQNQFKINSKSIQNQFKINSIHFKFNLIKIQKWNWKSGA